MQFCPQCKFMTYTKLNRTESPPILENYCKNCGWKGIKDFSSKAIYKRNYKEDYIAEKVLSNKYTIFDVTLPRVEYECINPECTTNTDFDDDYTLIISNIPADHTDEQFDEIFRNCVSFPVFDISIIEFNSSSLLFSARILGLTLLFNS